MVKVLVRLIVYYHWLISPWLGNRCRYVPSCSAYAIQALQEFGVGKGLWMTIKRLSRCHPWGSEGYDPLPLNADSVPQQSVNHPGVKQQPLK